ncbi:MAG: hypothetical protein ACLSHC_10935 [Bilophila wadsworthia]
MVPNIEMVRMVNSGTEAVMSALRLLGPPAEQAHRSRAATTALRLYAGQRRLLRPGRAPSSAACRWGGQDTLTAQFNDLASIEPCWANPGQVAAVIVEPVAPTWAWWAPPPAWRPAGSVRQARRPADL